MDEREVMPTHDALFPPPFVRVSDGCEWAERGNANERGDGAMPSAFLAELLRPENEVLSAHILFRSVEAATTAAGTVGALLLASREKLATNDLNDSMTMAEDLESEQADSLDENLSDAEFVRSLLAMPMLVVLVDPQESSDEFEAQLDKIVEECQEIHISDYRYFVTSKKGYFPEDSPAVIYYYNPKTKEVECYAFPNDLQLNVATVRQILAEVREGDAKRFYPSEPRPPEDRHPKVKSVYVATTESFKDVVLNTEGDVLLRLGMPSPRPSQPLETLSRVLGEEDKNGVRVVSMASFVNVPDPRYFDEESNIIAWKFFPAGDKEHPITFAGPSNNVYAILKWISDVKNDNAEKLYLRMKRADSVQMQRDIETALGRWFIYSYVYRDYFDTPEQRRAISAQKRLKQLYSDLVNEKDHYRSSFRELRDELERELTGLEARALRNVKKIPDDQFDQALKEAKSKSDKVVVFFWRDGCLPCMSYNTIIGRASEELSDIPILKVNARVLNLPATPTFYVYQGDREPQQYTGREFKAVINKWYQERGLPDADARPVSQRRAPISEASKKQGSGDAALRSLEGTLQQGPSVKLARGQ